MVWNARILSTSAPDLPELRPCSSGLYDVLVFVSTVSKLRPRESHDSSASSSMVALSPEMYGRKKETLSLSQLPIEKVKVENQ